MDWEQELAGEKQRPYFIELMNFLESERQQGKTIYPPEEEVFQALKLTSLSDVRVVILGQDPYHGPGQAHGLAFSVRRGIPLPPSLRNIYKELASDLEINPPAHGDLAAWARQGVLLLNTVLTVEAGKAGSHHDKGWENFTDKIIQLINEYHHNIVFILWGAPAQKKAAIVDPLRHYLIKSPHPSPLSSYRGFFGSKPFSRTNEFLLSKGLKRINWEITD